MLFTTMEGERQPQSRRVEVYVRSLQPDGYCQQQASMLDRIAALVCHDIVSERVVQVCGCQVPATPDDANTTVGRHLAARVAEFRAWAARNDCSLGPAVEVRHVDDTLADAHYRAVRLPAILLAEFDGDDLLCVTPHRREGTVTTVDDRVAQLAVGEPAAFDPLAGGAHTAAGSEDRPETSADDPVQLPPP